jgi:predicted Zn-dependent peptidase
MHNFRSQAPPVNPIENLVFDKIEPVRLGKALQCYRLPQRNLGVVKFDIFWPYGTLHQDAKYVARTSLGLALSGTNKISADQINEELEYLGTSIGYETHLNHSVFTLKSNKENFLKAFQFLQESFAGVIYPQAEIDNYKQIEQAGLMRKMQTPRYWSHRLCFEAMFGGNSPMASFANVEDIQSITALQLKQYHANFLNFNNASHFLSGDVDGQIWDAFMLAITNNKTPQSPLLPKVSHENPKTLGEIDKKPMEHAHQVSLLMGKTIHPLGEREIHTFSLLNMLLGGFFGSRLMQEIREEKGLTYGIGSYISQTNEGNSWCISCEMNSQNTAAAMEGIRAILEGLKTNPPAGDELERAKRYYCGQLRSSFDGPFALSSKIRNLLTRNYTYEHYSHAMDDIWKITGDELCSLADNYLNPESFHIAMAGDLK